MSDRNATPEENFIDNNLENIVLLTKEGLKNKEVLNSLKRTAVLGQFYELAANLREAEKTLFPEFEEKQLAKKQGKEISDLFRMSGINISHDMSWLIFNTLSEYKKKKGKFSIKEVVQLKNKRLEFFDLPTED